MGLSNFSSVRGNLIGELSNTIMENGNSIGSPGNMSSFRQHSWLLGQHLWCWKQRLRLNLVIIRSHYVLGGGHSHRNHGNKHQKCCSINVCARNSGRFLYWVMPEPILLPFGTPQNTKNVAFGPGTLCSRWEWPAEMGD